MQTTLSSSPAASQASGGLSLTGAADTKDMFTKLLVAQIRNQDPLEPTDPSQFVNQLTQLSQTESLQALSTQASTNAGLLQSLQAVALGAQVGSSVSVTTDHVTLGTSAVHGGFTLQDASAKTTLVLTSIGNQQTAIDLGPQPAGPVSFSIDPSKLGLPAGTYTMSVSTGSKETPSIAIDGTLGGVHVSSSGVQVDVAGVGSTDLSAITAFNGPAAASPN